MYRLLPAALAFLSFACATTAPNQQPPPALQSVEVELEVKDVDAEMVSQLTAAFLKVDSLRSARLKSHTGRIAVFIIQYPGDAGRLPAALAQVPNPGLRYAKALHRFEYGAFDNQPPSVTFVHPHPEQVLTVKEQFITLEVPDKDLASLTLDGRAVPLYKGALYRLKVTLQEGRQELVALAKDKAGNETPARVAVVVDTTAPAIQAQVKLLIEGTVEPGSTVLIDGLEVAVDGQGRYRAEVPTRKGQKKVEIVAIDASGNKSVTVKTLGE